MMGAMNLLLCVTTALIQILPCARTEASVLRLVTFVPSWLPMAKSKSASQDNLSTRVRWNISCQICHWNGCIFNKNSIHHRLIQARAKVKCTTVPDPYWGGNARNSFPAFSNSSHCCAQLNVVLSLLLEVNTFIEAKSCTFSSSSHIEKNDLTS